MKFTPLDIPDVLRIEPRVAEDARGFFMETFRKGDFSEQGITDDFVQDNHAKSQKGALRGLHYQIEPKAQAKLVRVVVGEIFDVVVDIRKSSPTFGKYVGVKLSAENRNMLYVPKGFAHGYLSLTEGAEVLYKVTALYSPEHERGLLWNDPAVGIDWPKMDSNYILSDKDVKHPSLERAALFS